MRGAREKKCFVFACGRPACGAPAKKEEDFIKRGALTVALSSPGFVAEGADAWRDCAAALQGLAPVARQRVRFPHGFYPPV